MSEIATKVRYSVKGSDIYRGDEIIASFQGGKVIPLPGCERYHIQASRAWNSVAPAVEEKVVPSEEPKAGENDELNPSDIPPMPAIDPTKGDKTPEVIRWYRDYRPQEFERRYKGRKFAMPA